MWPGHMWGDGWMWLIGALVMFIFWGGVIGLVIIAIRAVARSNRDGNEPRSSSYQRENPKEILKERYARGEISRDEYLAMRRDLEE
jgi:putative membrane protein